jgi:SAM-dependent methyltransferase
MSTSRSSDRWRACIPRTGSSSPTGRLRSREHARAKFPGIPFLEGNIDDLPLASHSVGGVLAWYSLIHHDPDAIDRVLDEFARALSADGTLLVGFFVGANVDTFDHAVVRAWRWSPDAFAERLVAAGFEVIETHTRFVPQSKPRPHGAILARRLPGH